MVCPAQELPLVNDSTLPKVPLPLPRAANAWCPPSQNTQSLMTFRILFPFWKYASCLPHYHLERVNLKQANITSAGAVQGPGQSWGLIQTESTQPGQCQHHHYRTSGRVGALCIHWMSCWWGPAGEGGLKERSLAWSLHQGDYLMNQRFADLLFSHY